MNDCVIILNQSYPKDVNLMDAFVANFTTTQFAMTGIEKGINHCILPVTKHNNNILGIKVKPTYEIVDQQYQHHLLSYMNRKYVLVFDYDDLNSFNLQLYCQRSK